MPRRLTTDGDVIVHESGHVVALRAYGARIRYVSMRPRDNRAAAHVVPVGRTPGTPLDGAIANMVISAAGMVAEDLAYNRAEDQRAYTVLSGADDLREMRDAARWIVARDLWPDATVDWLARLAWQRAVHLIFRQWRQVAVVAGALYGQTRAVTGAQLADAIVRNQPAPFVRRAGLLTWGRRPTTDDLLFWPAAYSRLAWRPVRHRPASREGARP